MCLYYSEENNRCRPVLVPGGGEPCGYIQPGSAEPSLDEPTLSHPTIHKNKRLLFGAGLLCSIPEPIANWYKEFNPTQSRL